MMEVVVGDDGVARCWWGAEPEIYQIYHDEEWGRPTTDDHRLFEKVCLEGFQAGLASAGTHDEVTATEARYLFISTYVVLGEILMLSPDHYGA